METQHLARTNFSEILESEPIFNRLIQSIPLQNVKYFFFK
jgi:hypothetical protein